MIRNIFAISILCLVFVSGSTASDVIPEPVGRINDFAGVISQEYRDKISAVIDSVETKTGAEIAVLTVSSISPYDEAGYSRLVLDKWKIGKKGKDNGVLILLAIKERAWRIETGYGMEAILPDGRCGDIGRNRMVPFFKDGRYDMGLLEGVKAVAGVITNEPYDGAGSISGQTNRPAILPSGIPDYALFIILPIFFFVWNLPWPVYIGLPFTIIFALSFSGYSPILGSLIFASYFVSMVFRFFYWRKLPPAKRRSLFGQQNYGHSWTTTSGGWNAGGSYSTWGGGFGGGGGGFGGGSGGGGGAGGRF